MREIFLLIASFSACLINDLNAHCANCLICFGSRRQCNLAFYYVDGFLCVSIGVCVPLVGYIGSVDSNLRPYFLLNSTSISYTGVDDNLFVQNWKKENRKRPISSHVFQRNRISKIFSSSMFVYM